MKVEHKLIAAFLIAALAVVLLGGMTYLNVHALFERHDWVVHTYRVLDKIDEAYDGISQIESGARGYLLTGQPEYLQAYQAGIDGCGAQIADLRALTADNRFRVNRSTGCKPCSTGSSRACTSGWRHARRAAAIPRPGSARRTRTTWIKSVSRWRP